MLFTLLDRKLHVLKLQILHLFDLRRGKLFWKLIVTQQLYAVKVIIGLISH